MIDKNRFEEKQIPETTPQLRILYIISAAQRSACIENSKFHSELGLLNVRYQKTKEMINKMLGVDLQIEITKIIGKT